MDKDDRTRLSEKLRNPRARLLFAVALGIITMYVWGSFFAQSGTVRYPITYTQFMEQLEAGNIDSVTIRGLNVYGKFSKETEMSLKGYGKAPTVDNFSTILPTFQGDELMEKLRKKGVAVTVEAPKETSLFWQILVNLLPWAIIIGAWFFIMRRTAKGFQGGPGGLFTFGQSKAKLYDATMPKVTFADVAGLEEVKTDLQETIDFLRDPTRFHTIGANIPRGVLLMGAPGTGKTLVARATAGEAGVPFFSISASEFIEMFVGVGASRVRDMFKKAKAAKPSIIFIDEIDAVGRTRGAGFGGGHDEREQTLNQLLGEMDGFEPNEEVIIMAATNRPDVLDPALLRPGRFDRRILIDRPGLEARKEIFQVHVRKKLLADDVDLDRLARGTPGMTGADIENLANEAALVAVRKGNERVAMEDFEEARDKILMGAERQETISDLERRITAYHESGHTLVAWHLPHTDPLHKVSIVPRGMAMGVTQLLPEEDRHYYPKAYLMDKLSVALAGRVAEKLVFDDTSTGAQSDLKEATSLAEKMVGQWGMSDKIGPIYLGRGEEHPFLGRELAQPKNHSEEMAWLVDQEIQSIIGKAEVGATNVLSEHRDQLERLAQALLEREVLDKGEVDALLKGEE